MDRPMIAPGIPALCFVALLTVASDQAMGTDFEDFIGLDRLTQNTTCDDDLVRCEVWVSGRFFSDLPQESSMGGTGECVVELEYTYTTWDSQAVTPWLTSTKLVSFYSLPHRFSFETDFRVGGDVDSVDQVRVNCRITDARGDSFMTTFIDAVEHGDLETADRIAGNAFEEAKASGSAARFDEVLISAAAARVKRGEYQDALDFLSETRHFRIMENPSFDLVYWQLRAYAGIGDEHDHNISAAFYYALSRARSKGQDELYQRIAENEELIVLLAEALSRLPGRHTEDLYEFDPGLFDHPALMAVHQRSEDRLNRARKELDEARRLVEQNRLDEGRKRVEALLERYGDLESSELADNAFVVMALSYVLEGDGARAWLYLGQTGYIQNVSERLTPGTLELAIEASLQAQELGRVVQLFIAALEGAQDDSRRLASFATQENVNLIADILTKVKPHHPADVDQVLNRLARLAPRVQEMGRMSELYNTQ